MSFISVSPLPGDPWPDAYERGRLIRVKMRELGLEEEWLDMPHPLLEGKTAGWACNNGKLGDVERILDQLASGAFI